MGNSMGCCSIAWGVAQWQPSCSISNPLEVGPLISQDVASYAMFAQPLEWRGVPIESMASVVQEKPSDEVPLEIVPAVVDLETKNTKRKFVFRLMTSLGQSYLLQVS